MSQIYSLADINTLSEQEWEYYYENVHSREKKYTSLEYLKNRLLTIDNISFFSRIYFIKENGIITASLVFSIGSASRPYDASLYTNGIIETSSRLNLFLLETIAGIMSEYGNGTLRLVVQCTPLKDLFLNFSIRVSKKVYLYSLKLDNEVKANLQKVYNAYSNTGYRLEIYNSLPGGLIETYCRYFSELVREIPGRSDDDAKYTFTPEECRKGEEHANKQGWVNIYMFLYKDSAIAGIANLVYNKGIGTTYHIITGIKEEHRGKGLSKLVKSALYLKLLDEYPEAKTVVTDNYDSNSRIIRVNEGLGFKVNREQIEFESSAGELNKILEDIRSVHIL
jgi:RimJ/RimL family protein N-acetyltransferase